MSYAAEAQARADEIIAAAEVRAQAMIETSEERCEEVESKILELAAARDHLLLALSGLNQQLTRALEYHGPQAGNGFPRTNSWGALLTWPRSRDTEPFDDRADSSRGLQNAPPRSEAGCPLLS